MSRPTLTATVFDKRGNVLAKESNSYVCTHPIQYQFANSVGEPWRIYLHAEIAAIIKAIKRGKPHKIKVERYDKQGNFKCAKPCSICSAAIRHYGIKYVEYSL